MVDRNNSRIKKKKRRNHTREGVREKEKQNFLKNKKNYKVGEDFALLIICFALLIYTQL